eukprot:Hpha_TRINITY_DN12904_c0_g1::TRINITY_DN12904_c0_g1_i2::g.164591::m.164591
MCPLALAEEALIGALTGEGTKGAAGGEKHSEEPDWGEEEPDWEEEEPDWEGTKAVVGGGRARGTTADRGQREGTSPQSVLNAPRAILGTDALPHGALGRGGTSVRS